MNGHDVSPSEAAEVDGEFTIQNEYTSVRIRKVKTGNGERLEISSQRVPHSIRLDALILESLTWRNVLDLNEGLTTPFGPESTHAHQDVTS